MNKNEIFRIYGTDYKAMTIRLLHAAGLASVLRDREEKSKRSGRSAEENKFRIAIKPNLVAPSPAEFGATTHPEIVEGIIEYLQENGYWDIVIAEGSWIGDKTEDSFEYCGYRALSEKSGVTLIDTQREPGVTADCSGMKLQICRCVRDFDFLINVPVLKGHCQTHVTCALKNLKGLIPNSEKRRFHAMGLHKPVAHLNTGIRQDFIVVDHICGDPDFEEGGHPLMRNCVMAGMDPVLIDTYAAYLLGWKKEEVPYIGEAEALGVGNGDLASLQIKEVDINEERKADIPREKKTLDIAYAVDDADSCSACYAALVPALERLKEEGLLEKLMDPVGIGQGHIGKTGKIGIGKCTKAFTYNIPGCPPDEEAVYRGLKEYILHN